MQPQSSKQQQQQQRTQQKTYTTRATTATNNINKNAQCTPTAATPTATSSKANAADTATSTGSPQTHRKLRIIKGKTPLQNFKFYLDICDHQLTKRIEEEIKYLGGNLEFFLTANVTHFITDKADIVVGSGGNGGGKAVTTTATTRNSLIGTPKTPATPQTPLTPDYGNATTPTTTTAGVSIRSKSRQSRADAILNRARTQTPSQVQGQGGGSASTTVKSAEVGGAVATPSGIASAYVVWLAEYALRFFKKVRHELKSYLEPYSQIKGPRISEPTIFRGDFIKIESVKRNYRPYYCIFKGPKEEWPRIELTRKDGAFRLSPKRELPTAAEAQEEEDTHKMTRKSGSRTSQRPGGALKKSGSKTNAGTANCKQQQQQLKDSTEKQCGVCEICKIEYDTLTIHLKTKDHEYFAKNPQNFIALDTLIQETADVNKFLSEDTLVEEMEVDETTVVGGTSQTASRDPLEESNQDDDGANAEKEEEEKVLEMEARRKRSSRSSNKTPSPMLREKSKRSTKGKHSSEKFQNLPKKSPATPTPPKTPKASPKSASPQKRGAAANSKRDVVEEANTTPVASKASMPSTRKRTPAPSGLSPPKRAMLPPSSLYKVVETVSTTGTANATTSCTPTRRTRDANNVTTSLAEQTASPSLIVKFKKVRAAELLRLHGEAENYLGRKQSTSSDLPTDVDRHTTSDVVNQERASSLDSTSDYHQQQQLDDDEDTENSVQMQQLPETSLEGGKSGGKRGGVVSRKAIAVARRRKGSLLTSQPSTAQAPQAHRCFPNAPIQPDIQLKRLPLSPGKTKTVEATECPMETASIAKALPEATRKSSRTATAIVTAATKSSRLIRAAVEAAKSKNRRRLETSTTTSTEAEAPVANNRRRGSLPSDASSRRKRGSNSVVELDDRMGENMQRLNKTSYNMAMREDDDDDGIFDDEEEDDDADDDDDEDYVASKKALRAAALKAMSPIKTRRGNSESQSNRIEEAQEKPTAATTSSRAKRALKRHRISKGEAEDEESPKKATPTKGKQQQQRQLLRQNSKSSSKSPKKSPPSPRLFDIESSERITNMKYAFERAPSSDLWYRVYTRQDECKERYFEYYGSTKYRKLPYELGPIPFEKTLDGICCKLCAKRSDQQQQHEDGETTKAQKEANTRVKRERDEANPREASHQRQTVKVKEEPLLGLHDNEQEKSKGEGLPKGVASSVIASTSSSIKHKKLHLLQRYRQEQQELLLRKQQQENGLAEDLLLIEQKSCDSNVLNKCDSPQPRGTSDTERLRKRERAGSTHSNASSCTSSSTLTSAGNKKYRNKHLMSLELPPRKSPREHASTLALVSCIIKQRQDSQSKPNSEVDEPPGTPTPNAVEAADSLRDVKPPAQQMTTRSSAATPVEEMQFATEISENVKRMRRGQNKYDYSPPIVLNNSRSPRGKGRCLQASLSKCGATQVKVEPTSPTRPTTTTSRGRGAAVGGEGSNARPTMVSPSSSSRIEVSNILKRKRRPKTVLPSFNATPTKQQHSYGGTGASTSAKNLLPSIRKTGSKKGVLEFEVDNSALKALDEACKYENVRKLEWEIDRYLQLARKDLELDIDLPLELRGASTPSTTSVVANKRTATLRKPSTSTAACDVNTPPPTDYFSSDFDLYDLVTNPNVICLGGDDKVGSAEGGAGISGSKGKGKGISLYSTSSLQSYFRRRKVGKSNRTGWPKVQRKKVSARQQQKIQKGRGGAMASHIKQEVVEEEEVGKDGVYVDVASVIHKSQDEVDSINQIFKREVEVEAAAEVHVEFGVAEEESAEADDSAGVVITPPITDDDGDEVRALNEDEDSKEEKISQAIANRDAEEEVSQDGLHDEEDRDTLAGFVEDDREIEDEDEEVDAVEAEAATDADVEDAHDGEEEEELHINNGHANIEDEVDDDAVSEEVKRSMVTSPTAANKLMNCLTVDTVAAINVATSTPTTKMLRGLRCTPQQHLLNGSLGSCISPTEKTVDNSDIFTVSSDGLDDDALDVSNDGHHNHHHHHSLLNLQHLEDGTAQCHHSKQSTVAAAETPRRKYDITKYAPNPNKTTCAAEAATAAVKSMAISQFLKKEVRVNCRRLRAPFRRFRYRR